MEITIILTTMLEQLTRVEYKVDRVDKRLRLFKSLSFSTIRVIVERTDVRTVKMMKLGKV